jgi:UTP--glucose-1-phosphate uridylyltransferase
MLPVGRKPVVQYVFEELTSVGVRRIVFITGPGKASIENHFDINEELVQALRESGKEDLLSDLEFERAPVQYFYTRQRRALGLGHAVLAARAFVNDRPFVVALGDSIIGTTGRSDVVGRLVRTYEARDAAAVIALEEVPLAEVHSYGIASPAAEAGDVFELKDLVEKPRPDEAPSRLAIAARYVLSSAVFEALERTRPGKAGEIQLTDAIRQMIRGGARVYGVRLGHGERRFDIGNFDSYFRAFVELALADPKHGASLRDFLIRLVNGHHS